MQAKSMLAYLLIVVGETCSTERKQHDDTGEGASSQAFDAIKTVTPVWVGTFITDVALSSTAEV